jgi:hypothetical protein
MQSDEAWAARRICRDCPVAEACLRDALETKDGFGIRGGLSPKQRTNLKKGRKPQRNRQAPGIAPSNASKTHCLNGHEFTPENTYVHKGHRNCKTCRRAYSKARHMVGAA